MVANEDIQEEDILAWQKYQKKGRPTHFNWVVHLSMTLASQLRLLACKITGAWQLSFSRNI